MNFVSLTVQGFRSFARRATLEFGPPGLVQVLGVNEVEPELDSNGSGKSSLFESLQWVLFGRTSRNLRAGDVATWEGKGEACEGTLELEDATHKYTVRRAWNPNELVLATDGDARPVDQETLERTLGYTPETFLYSVFHAQFIDNFATLTPSRQLEIYTAALRLDLWEELSDLASRRAAPIRTEIVERERSIARLRGIIGTLRVTLEAEQEKELEWHRGRWYEALARSVELTRMLDAHDALVAEKRGLGALKPDESALTKLQDALDAAHKADINMEISKGVIEDRIADTKKDAARFRGISRCPTCKQPIDPKLIAQHYDCTQLEHNLANIAEQRRQARERYDTLKTQWEAENKRTRTAADAYLTRAAALNERLRTVENDIDRAVYDLQKLARQTCPHDTQTMEDEIARNVADLDTGNRGLESSTRRLAGLEFWSKGFRDIRLALVDESLAQFEAVANNTLHILGLQDWAIEFGVESETKGGKLHKGFTVHIRSPYNTDRVPFLAWSGGESQRLALAIGIGFSDLVRDFSGVASNIEIWDEASKGLSEGGVENVLELLKSRSDQCNITTFLIEHRMLEFGGFDRTLVVIKDQHGSRIKL